MNAEPGAPQSSESGFTLVETLVAFAILAVSLAALSQSLSGGLRSVAKAERVIIATSLARSILNRVGTDLPLAPGRRNGQADGGLAWSAEISPANELIAGGSSGANFTPYRVVIEVKDGGGILIDLETLKLAVHSDGNDS